MNIRHSAIGRLSLGAVLPILVLSACSSSTPQAAAPSVLAQVLSRGTLRVAIIVPNPPYAQEGPSGTLTGYEVDIANLLAKDLGVKTQFIQTDNPGRVTLVQTRKADVAIATFTSNLQRMQVINFTNPIDIGVQVLMALASNPLTQIGQFNKAGIKIAVATGGTQVQAVTAQLPLATEVQFPTPDDAIQAVISGQADAAATGNTTVGAYEKANPGKLQLVQGQLGAPEDNGIGVVQGDFTWWNYVNFFVNSINSDGTTCALWQKYFGAGTSPGPFATCL